MPQDLFQENAGYQPLAARVRPRTLNEYVGQQHLLAEGRSLHTALARNALHSMVLWGPPGVGKTTFALLLAEHYDAAFESLSAVLSGVKDIRAAIDRARLRKRQASQDTVLFVDEVHRFNKSQQDAFLPYIEDGTVVFVGATTENPSFELNNALLSRTRVYVLKVLSEDDLLQLIDGALSHPDGFPELNVVISQDLKMLIAQAAQGDGRRALNILELAIDLAPREGEQVVVARAQIEEVLQSSLKRFDKGGDIFYEQISALHKSVRGSDPDAALYWFVRMIDAGCDPLYVARRVVRMASEDIGNADPRALQVALAAWDVQERLGSPEGELSLAQAIIYLAVAPKSNAVYSAFNACRALVRHTPDCDVPMHLRNAPTALMKEQGMGEDYRYAHDEPDAFAAGENYFPEELADTRLYEPVARGLEIKISEKLAKLRAANRDAVQQRYRRR
ncbi:MAG: replication-associated recombination protein A [Oleiphilaceae bacterium]|nr:replication-associated recombination protein A [Oleiphilaceae bacterium]